MQRLHEPPQEAPAVAQVLLHDRDQLRPQMAQRSQRRQIASGHVVQTMVHPVHNSRLTRSDSELTQLRYAPDFALQRLELERQAERAREIGQPAPRGFK